MSDNEWIEFKADGTFIYFNKTASTAFDGFKDNTFVGWEGSFVQSGARSLTIKGKYSIQSGSIKCTDMSATLESLYSNETFPDEYKNKPMDNTSWPYKFSKGITGGSGAYDALEFLEIDMFGGGYKGFIIPIDLNAIKGVVNYPSALPNSISPTEINCIFTSASGEKDAWQHRFEATFACSSETEMKTKAGAYFARLEAMGFDKGYLYDYRQGLDVEGKISGKTYKITCSYISFAKQAVLYFDILN